MDQRPNDRLSPRDTDPLTDDVGQPTRTGWDRVTRTDEGAWNYIPLLLVAALIAIGGWLLIASDRSPTTPRTSENTPSATAPARPTPNTNAAPQPSTPPASSPSPANKP